MDSNDDHPLYGLINHKLAEILAASPVPLPWQEAWQGLSPTSGPREWLGLFKEIRDSGTLPAEAGFFLVAWVLDHVADEQAEDALGEHESKLQTLREKYGLDEDAPVDDSTPAEYRLAMQEAHRAWDELYASTLEEASEPEMAALCRDDRPQFDREYRAGQEFFHGEVDEDEDDWLDALLDAVSACVEAESPMGPLGLRYMSRAKFPSHFFQN